MLLLEPNKIREIENQIYTLEQSAENGLLSETDVIAATNLAMNKIKKLKHDFVDKVHSWNERDKKPRTKPVRGKTVTYFMTHIHEGKDYKQLTANSLDSLYDKLYGFYALDNPTGIRPDITLSELYDIFMIQRRRDAYEFHTITTQTAEYDVSTWKRFYADSSIARQKVVNISQRQVYNEFKRITGAGELSRKTFNKAKTLLDSIFDLALEANIIPNNPSRVISKRNLKFKQEENKDKVYTTEERSTLIEYLKSQEQTIFTLSVRLAFCFCLRIGELTALTWKDYDPVNRTIHVHHQIVYTAKNGKKRVMCDVPHTKANTPDGNRYLFVTDEASEILEELRKINGNKHYILSATRAENPITVNSFNEHLREYCNACGIRYLSSHKIRFFGATELFNAGVDPEQIRRVMGHTNIAMTEHYNRTNGKINIDLEIWKKIFGKPDDKEKPDK